MNLKDLTPFVNRSYTQEETRDFFPGQWQAAVIPFGERAGVRYGVPRQSNVLITYYHNGLFQEAGVETPDVLFDRGEWTWDTLLEASRKLTRRGADGEVVQWGYRPRYEGGRFSAVVWANGGKVFGWPEDPLSFRLDQPEAIQAIEFAQSLIHEHQVAYPSINGPDFDSGIFGMGTRHGSGNLKMNATLVGDQFEWNVAPPARGPRAMTSMVFNDSWGMWEGTSNPEASWKFIEFASSFAGQEILAQYWGSQPVRRSALSAYIAANPGIDAHYVFEAAAVAQPEPWVLIPRPSEIRGLVEGAVLTAITENKPAQIAIREIADAVRELLRSAE